jgi:hypothetical protein
MFYLASYLVRLTIIKWEGLWEGSVVGIFSLMEEHGGGALTCRKLMTSVLTVWTGLERNFTAKYMILHFPFWLYHLYGATFQPHLQKYISLSWYSRIAVACWVAANKEATEEARVTSGKVEDIISKVLLSPQLLE